MPHSPTLAQRSTRALLPALGLLLLAPGDALADRVVTTDGRQLQATRAREEGQGYRLEFPHGTIVLADGSRVKAVEIEGDMSEYEPRDENERKNLEKGYVRYRGKWMSKNAYEVQLKKEAEEARAAADAAMAYNEFADALEAESRYFQVRTNTSPELLAYYCDLLDEYYKLMNKRLGIKPSPSMRGEKLWVNVYKNREEFLQKTGMPPGVGGFFRPDETRSNLNFYHDYAEPAKSEWVALHECTHLLTYLLDQQFRPQIWINEAVADYFGSSTIESDKRGDLTITPGKLQTDRVLTVQQAIADGDYVRLEDLFTLTKAEFQAFEYAHAWSLVYFLNVYDDGKYESGFQRFFRDLYSLKGVEYSNEPGYGSTAMAKVVAPEEVRALLLKRIGVEDVEALQEEWLGFLREVDIDAPLARMKRGIRRAYDGDFDAAVADLDAAIEGGIEDPEAFSSRAFAAAMAGDTDAAVEDAQRAIELAPLAPIHRYDLSHYLLGGNRYLGLTGRGSTDAEVLAAARTAAGLAVDLDPENRAYAQWLEVLEAL